MARHLLLTNAELAAIAENKISAYNLDKYKAHIPMALELQEWRRTYGKLECEWLEGPGKTLVDEPKEVYRSKPCTQDEVTAILKKAVRGG